LLDTDIAAWFNYCEQVDETTYVEATEEQLADTTVVKYSKTTVDGVDTYTEAADGTYVAETERDFIKKRQAEGIAAAKARGVQFGPKRKPLPENFYEVREQWRRGEISIRKARKLLNMPHSSFYRICNEQIKNENNTKSQVL